MTKIPSRKPSGTYGHGPLKICFWKGKDDDHDQDFLKKDLLHIWSWSSDKSFSLLELGNHAKGFGGGNFWGIHVFMLKASSQMSSEDGDDN